MKLVVDADALIELQRAGVLAVVVRFASVCVGREVWREAVVQGKAGGHEDAEEIERLADRFRHEPAFDAATIPAWSATGLGAGEIEAWQLMAYTASDAIVSDDRAFLRALEAAGVPFLTPAALIVAMARHAVIEGKEAHRALEALRPFIAAAQYSAAMKVLEQGGDRS